MSSPRRYANYYKRGGWNIQCQRTGFKIKNTQARREWNNLVVRRQSWEPRHPQDFVRGVKDLPGVHLARPRPTQEVANNANLLPDRNGWTADGVEWDLGTDWGLATTVAGAADGWEVTASAPFNVSTDLVTARSQDIAVGANESVSVGDTLYLSGYITLTTRTAGSLIGKLRFYQSDRTTVVQTSTMFTLSADAANARSSGSVAVPTNAAFIQVIWDASSLQASAMELRNVKLEIGSLTAVGEKVTY